MFGIFFIQLQTFRMTVMFLLCLMDVSGIAVPRFTRSVRDRGINNTGQIVMPSKIANYSREFARSNSGITSGMYRSVTNNFGRIPNFNSMHNHGLPSSLHNHGLPSSMHNYGFPSSMHNQGLPSGMHNYGFPSSMHNQGLPSSMHNQGLPSSMHNYGFPSSMQNHDLPSGVYNNGFPKTMHYFGSVQFDIPSGIHSSKNMQSTSGMLGFDNFGNVQFDIPSGIIHRPNSMQSPSSGMFSFDNMHNTQIPLNGYKELPSFGNGFYSSNNAQFSPLSWRNGIYHAPHMMQFPSETFGFDNIHNSQFHMRDVQSPFWQ